MATYPTTPTIATLEAATSAKANQAYRAIDWVLNPPRCYAYDSATTSGATGVYQVISLGAEVFDRVMPGDTASHDNTTNNSRIYARTTCLYRIGGQITWASNATGNRYIQVRSNAAGNPASGANLYQATTNALNGVTTSALITPIIVPLTAGDYIEIFGFQSSGGNLSTTAGQNNTFLILEAVGS